jgi:hypothetical protein
MAKLGKAQQELGAQQRQAKAKVSGGVPKDAQEPLILDTAKVSSFLKLFFAPLGGASAEHHTLLHQTLALKTGRLTTFCQSYYRQKHTGCSRFSSHLWPAKAYWPPTVV